MVRRRRPSLSRLALRWLGLAVVLVIALGYVQPLRAYLDARRGRRPPSRHRRPRRRTPTARAPARVHRHRCLHRARGAPPRARPPWRASFHRQGRRKREESADTMIWWTTRAWSPGSWAAGEAVPACGGTLRARLSGGYGTGAVRRRRRAVSDHLLPDLSLARVGIARRGGRRRRAILARGGGGL